MTQWKSKYVVLQPNYFLKNNKINILHEIWKRYCSYLLLLAIVEVITDTVKLKYQIVCISSLADVSRMDSKILVNKLALCRLFCCAQRLTCFWLSIICSHVAESGVRMPEVYSATNSHRDITEREGAKVARFLSLLCASWLWMEKRL